MVRVRLEYRPNGSSIAEANAKISGASRTALREALDENQLGRATTYQDGCLVFADTQAIIEKVQELV